MKCSTLAVLVFLLVSSSPASALPFTEYTIPTANSHPEGITRGPDGNLWFVEESGNKIAKLTTSGTITEYSIPTANSSARRITTGPDGNLWFAETIGNNIGTITTSGTITEYAIPTADSFPNGITTGPDGNLWFTETSGNKVGKVTPSGAFTEYLIPTANSGADDIVAGPDGNLWFVELSVSKIGKVTLAGAITEYALPPPLSYPRSIAVGQDGNLWFAETIGNKIGKITMSGTITEYSIPTASSAPYGITAGPDGNLWFTEGATSANKIGKVTPAGLVTESVVSVPTANGRPLLIAAGPDGNLWFTEFNANKIGKVPPSPVNSQLIGLDARDGSNGFVGTPQTLAAGATYTKMRAAITGAGHGIASVPSFTRLIGLRALILRQPVNTTDGVYTPSEIAAIHEFVATGGGLMVIAAEGSAANNSNGYLNAIVSTYGVTFAATVNDLSAAPQTVSGFVAHAVTNFVSLIGIGWQRRETVGAPGVDLTTGGGAANMLSAFTGTAGGGNGVFLGSSIWEDSAGPANYVDIDYDNNLLLLNNAIAFITTNSNPPVPTATMTHTPAPILTPTPTSRTPTATRTWTSAPTTAATPGGNLGDPKRAKAAVSCQSALADAALKHLSSVMKLLTRCTDRVMKCVQIKPGDEKCSQNARLGCAGDIATIQSLEGKLQSTSESAACGRLATEELFGLHGLAFGSSMDPCLSGRSPTLASVVECTLASLREGAQVLVSGEVPRAREFIVERALQDASRVPYLPDFGTAEPAGAFEGKAVTKCSTAVKKSAQKLAAAEFKGLRKCALAALGCVQQKPTDPSCMVKARDGCMKELGKIGTAETGLDGALAKGCTAGVSYATLRSPRGLNLDPFAAQSCADVGVPNVDDLASYGRCLQRQHTCKIEELLRNQIPRLGELYVRVGRTFGHDYCPNEGLPPDPGEAGKQTIPGIDSDGDGLRDDVQRAIASLPTNLRDPARQYALALQQWVVTTPSDTTTALEAAAGLVEGMQCVYGSAASPASAAAIATELRATTLNTEARSRRYAELSEAANGAILHVEPPGDYLTKCSASRERQGATIRAGSARALGNTGCAVTVYFANGVLVGPDGAVDNMAVLHGAILDKIGFPRFDSLRFDIAYNHTRGFVDFIEAAGQAITAGQWPDFWRFLGGSGVAISSVSSVITAALALAVTDEVTSADVQQQVDSYLATANAGRQILVVPHSQGNFFTNVAYDDVVPRLPRGMKFKVVSVANPAKGHAGDGPYLTLDEDKVIMAIPNAEHSNFSNKGTDGNGVWDAVGHHSFAAAYLAGPADSRSTIQVYLDDALQALCECGNGALDANEACDPPGQQSQCAKGWICGADCKTCDVVQPCNVHTQSGDDTPFDGDFDLGKTSGTFNVTYDTFTREDRITITYDGQVIFDTGCVGDYGTVPVPFNGSSTIAHVHVTPNCADPSMTGTQWEFTIDCP